MYPYRGIVCTYRQSDRLYMIPDELNNVTQHYGTTKRIPQGPPSRPRYMGSCLFHGHATYRLTDTNKDTTSTLGISTAITNTMSTAVQCQESAHISIRYTTLAPSLAFKGFSGSCFRLDFTHLFFYLIILNCFLI